MDHKKVGFFKIKEKKGNVNYYFELLYNIKIHLIFHILLLEKAINQILFANIFTYKSKKNNIYKIEKILNKKNN